MLATFVLWKEPKLCRDRGFPDTSECDVLCRVCGKWQECSVILGELCQLNDSESLVLGFSKFSHQCELGLLKRYFPTFA